MTKKEQFYLFIVLLHVGMGFLFFFLPFIGKIYGVGVFIFGLLYVINTQNRNNEVLLMAAYFTGIDVYLKMIDAAFLNEYGKYTVMIFMVIGMFYKGFSKGAFLYVVFLALLLPGIFIATESLSLDANIRKAIAFNITGPACLGVCAIYTFQRSISFERIKDVLTMLMLPLVAMVVNLILFTPSVRDVVTSTQSNFATSGGFGPNQVATVLGLGMFFAFAKLLLDAPTKKLQIINGILVLVFAFRGIVTFSRGGVLTGLIMMVLFLVVLYRIVGLKGRGKILVTTGIAAFAGLLIWGYTSIQTGGLIDKRYANEDARGRKKESALSGRETLIATELNMFLNNPYLGVGVGKNKEIREQKTGIEAASHNEITRMLAEHGSLGLAGLLILFITPIALYLGNRYQIFALVFMVFWLLTINHAAMRIAAPAFVYSLALLKVNFSSPNNTDEDETAEEVAAV
ncbi:O-antigen ligase [Flavobacterium antarcticum]|uniref:O-antigen ligase family protein n=1 Tax=Flavobacterium antarcticum TaxID=271155 RepID=UPI0003B34FFD|nr:O-antigen ligase family protein [Flavobacterium antarcticum]